MKNAFQILFSLIFVFAFYGCSGYSVKEDALLGKSKEQIIEIAFQHFPRVLNNEVKISTVSPTGSLTSYYYEAEKDALADSRIIEHDLWATGYKKVFSINGKINFYKLRFENNKVVEITRSAMSDF